MMMNIAKAVTEEYSSSLDKRPMLTEMCTSGCLWCLGDLATQQVERMTKDKSGLDWKRTLNQLLYASLIWGPIAHKWYHFLDHLAERFVEATAHIAKAALSSNTRLIITKFVLEMLWLHPLSLLAYFTIVGTLNGEPWMDIQRQLRSDYYPTFLFELALWTPIDLALFALVPVQFQLLAVNCACFLESIGLSFVKNNGIGSVIQSIPFLRKANVVASKKVEDDKKKKE